jgi:dihydrofolate reductase
MAENRVIGAGNRIPWHLPEDFRWFKQCTLGNVIVVGRRTFESLGRPLPGRTNLVLTRDPDGLRRSFPQYFPPADASPGIPGEPQAAGIVTSLDQVRDRHDPSDVFLCGGTNVYEQALPLCAELLLTRVKRTVEGDAFFPAFEHLFNRAEILRDTPDFTIERWARTTAPSPTR